MMTPSNGNIFRVTGPLWGEPVVTVDPVTKASDAELDVFLSAPEQTVEQTIETWGPLHQRFFHSNPDPMKIWFLV